MSYEGFTEYLCKNGHRWTLDVMSVGDSPNWCPECREKPVWSHDVDETNGICYLDDARKKVDPATVPYPLKVDHYVEKVIKVPIYKVPKK